MESPAGFSGSWANSTAVLASLEERLIQMAPLGAAAYQAINEAHAIGAMKKMTATPSRRAGVLPIDSYSLMSVPSDPLHVAVTDQAVIDPTELRGNPSPPLRHNRLASSHA